MNKYEDKPKIHVYLRSASHFDKKEFTEPLRRNNQLLCLKHKMVSHATSVQPINKSKSMYFSSSSYIPHFFNISMLKRNSLLPPAELPKIKFLQKFRRTLHQLNHHSVINFMNARFQSRYTIQSNNLKSAKMPILKDGNKNNNGAGRTRHSANKITQFDLDYEAVPMKSNSRQISSVILKAKQMVRLHKQFIYNEMYKMEMPNNKENASSAISLNASLSIKKLDSSNSN